MPPALMCNVHFTLPYLTLPHHIITPHPIHTLPHLTLPPLTRRSISINLVEVTWKSKLKAAFPDPNAYSAFMGNFSTGTSTVDR
jgi:hypothetical protein